MFLHVSVILSTGGGSAPLHAGIHLPPGTRGRHPPPQDQRQVPLLGADTPLGPEVGTPSPGRRPPPRTRGRYPPGADTPQDQRQVPLGPEAGTPSPPGADTSRTRGRYPSPLGADPGPEAGISPGADTPSPTRGRYPPEQTPPRAVHAGRHGQQAGGAHPTGMQSS